MENTPQSSTKSYRGISWDFLKSLGVSSVSEGILIPLYSVYFLREGQIIERSDKSLMKYNSSIPSGHLYNEQVLPNLFYGKPIVVVEGPYDCLSLAQAGISCVAMCTNRLTKRTANKILRYTNRIVFWPDSDKMGEEGLKDNLKLLAERAKVRVFKENTYKDANEFLQSSPEGFSKAILRLKELLEDM